MTAQNLKKSLLNYAISGKLSANWRKKNLNSRIPTDLNSRIPTDFKPPFGIPNSWAWVKLGDLGEVILGGTPSTQNENYFGGDIAWVTPADLNENTVYISKGRRNITEEGLKNSSAKLMPKGSVLFSTRAPVGYAAIAENEISTKQGFISIVLKDFAFNKYIYFVLKSLNNLANSLAGGTTFKELSSTNFKSLPIPLPPKNEQEFIVNELERLMSLADSYEVEFQKLENCKKELRNLKKSLLNYAISGKLSANWRKKNLNSRIPNDLKSRIPSDFNPPFEIPNSWQWVKLGDLGEYKKGPFGSSLTKSMFVPKSENSIKVYEQKNAIQKNFELGDYFITKEYFLEKMQGFIIKPNDIIISCAGTIGEVYRIPKEAPQGIINQALMRVRLNDLTIFE